MKLFTTIILLLVMTLPTITSADVTGSGTAYVLEIDGIISPASANYFERGLTKAQQDGAQFVLLRLDTPGGLDISMRSMIKAIIASNVPVITYVSPSGARAASAGTYILYASHIAAMAPATNVGAATPVQLKPSFIPEPDKETPSRDNAGKKTPENIGSGDAMTHKIINDAVAYIRGLAKLHNRNQEWAEQAVRGAASLTAEEALNKKVIDIVATNQHDLLRQIDGRKVSVQGQELTLNTTGVPLKELLPDWRNKLLDVITNPNIAYILMMIGIYGLIFEFANPGSIAPGTIGSICLLLALFSFQILPINYAGLALILLGIGLMVAEAFQPSFGVLGLGGVAAFVAGSVMLFDSDMPGYGVNMGLIAGFTVSTVAFFVLALGLVFKARHHPVVSGREEMLGAECEVMENFVGRGRVRVHSETWQAYSAEPLTVGQKARVISIKGLVLNVAPVTTEEN